jgi:branched-chain amino acid aminotransferase
VHEELGPARRHSSGLGRARVAAEHELASRSCCAQHVRGRNRARGARDRLAALEAAEVGALGDAQRPRALGVEAPRALVLNERVADAGDAVLRLVVTRGGRRLGLVEPLKALPDTVALQTITYSPTRVLDGVKSLSYGANMLAGRLARERGADEALLVTPHGRVLEGPTWTFFWVREGRLHTPPLIDGILDSITRGRLLEELDVTESPCTLDDVRAAEEAFIASSVREVLPISAVDDIVLPQAPGPVTETAYESFKRRVARELAAPAVA